MVNCTIQDCTIQGYNIKQSLTYLQQSLLDIFFSKRMPRCKIFNSEFHSYYKIAIHDHFCMSNFGVSDIPEQMP